MRRWPLPRIRSNAARQRQPAWRRWGWRPAPRIRCRGSGSVRRQARPHQPSTAPSMGTRTRWPPPRARRWRRPLPAVPAWPTTGLASRSATRRAAIPRGCRRWPPEHLLGAHLLEFVDALAEKADVGVVVVLSRSCGAGIADAARRFGQQWRDSRSQHRPAEPLVVMLDKHAAGPQLRIVDHVGDGVDRTGDHTCGAEGFDDVVRFAFSCPIADDLV